ncbi:MAG: hypothetical protein NWE76_01415 [Candidatus Bathyarchaeota archaeon]|nr:hypothetical protein [Candidatus Bathyarchaeota archaeon]
MLWDRKLVSSRWMLTYIRKAEAVELLEAEQLISDDFVSELRQRQATHMEKAIAARKSRAERFGVSSLTHQERVEILVKENSPLEYVGTKTFEDGFESATGSRRGKYAVILKNADGEELLFTKGEAKIASAAGVSIPFSAFSPSRGNTVFGSGKTIKDVFG